MRRPPAPVAPDDHLLAAIESIRRILHALRASARRAESLPGGVTGAQLFVLQTLADGPVRSLNELASRTFTHQSTVSVVVRRLVERGLVIRHRSAADARRLELQLSPRGRKLVRRSPPMAQHRLIRGLHDLSRRDARELARLLARLVELMGAARGAAAMFFEAQSAGGRGNASVRRRRAPRR
ncbi:MAG: MarR family winged helix-turn-helix transcriptional regulator [Gemmatimonadales bacterium]